MITGIYQIRNLVNGKRYIGSAAGKGFRNRWGLHIKTLRDGDHHNEHLQNAWNKHGEESFVFEILEECEPQSCIECEQRYLDSVLFASCNDERFKQLGYNICRVAGSTLGMKWTKRQKQRRSGINHPMYGRTHSVEARHRISLAVRKRHLEGDRSMTYNKISESLTGKKLSKAHRSNIARSHIGLVVTEKTRNKMSESSLDTNRGSKNGRVKLDQTEVVEIKKMLSYGVKCRVIAERFNVSISTIKSIKRGDNWGWLNV
jgi:group I intron endonuclease